MSCKVLTLKWQSSESYNRLFFKVPNNSLYFIVCFTQCNEHTVHRERIERFWIWLKCELFSWKEDLIFIRLLGGLPKLSNLITISEQRKHHCLPINQNESEFLKICLSLDLQEFIRYKQLTIANAVTAALIWASVYYSTNTHTGRIMQYRFVRLCPSCHFYSFWYTFFYYVCHCQNGKRCIIFWDGVPSSCLEKNDTALSILSNESAVSLLMQSDSTDKWEQTYRKHNIYL